MHKKRTKNSTCVVYRSLPSGAQVPVGYLTAKDEERGEDVRLDLQGYTVCVIDDVVTISDVISKLVEFQASFGNLEVVGAKNLPAQVVVAFNSSSGDQYIKIG